MELDTVSSLSLLGDSNVVVPSSLRFAILKIPTIPPIVS